jgi:hypothetical protein
MAIPTVVARWKEREIPDSFVCVPNKLAATDGNGELEYYLGSGGPALTAFFGNPGFRHEGFVHRRCLLDVLDALRDAYLSAFSGYRGGQSLVNLWTARRNELLAESNDILRFSFQHAAHRQGERVYISSDDPAWEYLRAVPLSGQVRMQIEKVTVGSAFEYCFQLAPIWAVATPMSGTKLDREMEAEDIESVLHSNTPSTEKEVLIAARRGQGRFRQDLLARGASCLVTGTTSPSLLVASHIKDWARCSDKERLDPYNGILLSPSLDRLFDLKLATIDCTAEEFVVSEQIPDADLAALGIQRRHPLVVRGVVSHERMRAYIADHNSRYRP